VLSLLFRAGNHGKKAGPSLSATYRKDFCNNIDFYRCSPTRVSPALESAHRVQQWFFIVGVILIVLGVYSVAGGFVQRADFKITYTKSAGQANMAKRGQRMASDITQRYGTMSFLSATGSLLILITIGIGQLYIPA